MRLPTGTERDDELAAETIAAAVSAGVTVFDTARAYGDSPGDNERLVAAALARCGGRPNARVVTKGGMSRVGGAWVADGRAKAIARDCEASLAALDGLPIDMYLLHAPDPGTPWGTSVRALGRLADQGLVRRVGLSNVNRRQLDDALELAPVGAVQVALSLNDQRAVRGGIVERCDELGIALIAHSPLGGPRRSAALPRREPLTEVAERSVAAPAEVALAWLLGLSAIVIAIPGARRPQTAQSAARAAGLDLDGSEREALDRAFASFSRARRPPAPRSDDREVLVVMGIPGAGKTRIAELYVRRGYARLNRDERGGSLREIADALDGALSSGGRRLVLDNTYLTRSARSYVIEAAGRHGIQARCIWLDTPLAQAQINLAARMLDLFGRLPEPGELQKLARTEPGVMAPTSQMRALRELEEPSLDEGFADVETIPFERSPAPGPSRAGVLVAAPVLRQPGWERTLERGEHDERDSPHLVFDWSPDGTTELLDPCVERLTAVVSGPVHAALCPHAGGPPRCWCRPPLPGLALTFARAHQLDLASSVVVGCRPTDRTLAGALGARYVTVPAR